MQSQATRIITRNMAPCNGQSQNEKNAQGVSGTVVGSQQEFRQETAPLLPPQIQIRFVICPSRESVSKMGHFIEQGGVCF